MKLAPNMTSMGVRIDDIDLSKYLSQPQFATVLSALGKYAVVWFPNQALDARALKAFSDRFGSLQGSPTGAYCEPDVPEVMLLSNIVEDGKKIGLADAGQDWHTDMSYNALVGFTNVLYGIKIPRRNGKPLGDTVFAGMHAAYDPTFRPRSRAGSRTPPPRTISTNSGKRYAAAPAQRAPHSLPSSARNARRRCIRFC
jgi:taurine dioxygenase